ncbi:iron-containing alcohol dehydrogenase [Candidatus Micrarchaeota archaeon]|nr:iron-containing alcohol dehydrogenase [Candidatus Micrarchaeota archaeon]
MKRVVVRSGALSDVGEVARDLSLGSRVLIVADETTWSVAGKSLSVDLKAKGFDVKRALLPVDSFEGRPVATDLNGELVARKVVGVDFLVGVGSGTVLDVTKYAGFLKGKRHVAFPTAPSMNGIASNVMALKVHGVKTTNPVAPPVAVVCDLNVLCEAPVEMVASGFADLMSKPTSFTDWKLCDAVRGCDACARHCKLCPLPRETSKNYEAKCAASAKEVGERTTRGIELLTLALLNSGFSMTLAGSSAPASGGEHLLSHLWDMAAKSNGRRTGWHGQQVGVATIIVACLYEELLSRSVGEFDFSVLEDDYVSEESARAIFSRVYGSELASEVMHFYSKKFLDWSDKKVELERLVQNWDAFKKDISAYTEKWQSVREKLEAVGSAVNASGLGLKQGEVDHALRYSRFIRERYTVLDLASELGVLNVSTARKILDETGVLE